MNAHDVRDLIAALNRIAAAVELLAGVPASASAARPAAPEKYIDGNLLAVPMRIALDEQGALGAVYHASHVLNGTFLPLYCGVEAKGEPAWDAAALARDVRDSGGNLCRSPGCRAQFR